MHSRLAATTFTIAAMLLAAGCSSDGSDDAGAAASASASEQATESATDSAATEASEADGASDEAMAMNEESKDSNQPKQDAQAAPVPAHLDFTATTVDGNTFKGASLAGEDAVLFFWAPWCSICRGEAPGVAAVAEDFSGQAEVIGVAGLSSDLGSKQEFVSSTGSGGMTHLDDSDGSIYSQFGVTNQYTYAFLDDSGELTVVVGPLSENELREQTDKLVAS